MFYQNILTELSPYVARVAPIGAFGEHRHADIEVHYPLEGSLVLIINKKSYTVKKGQLLLISPMAAHAVPSGECAGRKALTLILGVSFLKKFFSPFSEAEEAAYLIDLAEGVHVPRELGVLLDETVALCEAAGRRELLIRGNMCKIAAYLMELIPRSAKRGGADNKETVKIAAIERALEMIYYDYASPLTVADAANATGYGKSNFCKIFKSITGDTFHSVLNHRRVDAASALLDETDLPISQISASVGFGETKSFCRVFKAVTSFSPGQYRRRKRG